MDRIERFVQNSGLKTVLKPLYTYGIRKPYWWFRRKYNPVEREIAGVSVEFVAEGPADLEYRELDSEEKVLSDVLLELRPDDVFFDIGANIGLYSMFASQKLPDGRVYAFEPSPPAYEKLQKNSEKNSARIVTEQIAITDSNGQVDLAVDIRDIHSRRSTLDTNSDATDYAVQSVPSRRLETVISERDHDPTVLKIDVEGAEYDVLCSLDDFSSVRVIFCEIHQFAFEEFGFSREMVIEILENKGFQIEHLYKNQETECIKATR